MADWKDILSEEDEKLDDDELTKYLEGTLSEEEKHAFEKKTAGSKFLNDAVEGLKHVKDKHKLDDYVMQLNKELRKNLTTRKQRVEKRRIKDKRWVLLAVLMILFMCVVVYVVVRLYHSQSNKPSFNTKPLTASQRSNLS